VQWRQHYSQPALPYIRISLFKHIRSNLQSNAEKIDQSANCISFANMDWFAVCHVNRFPAMQLPRVPSIYSQNRAHQVMSIEKSRQNMKLHEFPSTYIIHCPSQISLLIATHHRPLTPDRTVNMAVHYSRQSIFCNSFTHLEKSDTTCHVSAISTDLQEDTRAVFVQPQFHVLISCSLQLWRCSWTGSLWA